MTRFSEMTQAARNGWIVWAQAHPWGDGSQDVHAVAYYDDMDGVIVTHDVTRIGIETRLIARDHACVESLKAWAAIHT